MLGLIAVLALSGSTQAVVHAAGSARATASATTHSITSSVSAKYNARKRVISGSVSYRAADLSPDEGGCVERRKVTLYKSVKVNGQTRLKAMDSETADDDGFYGWKFTSAKAAQGTWTVKVERRVFSDRYADLVECSAAKAPSIRI